MSYRGVQYQSGAVPDASEPRGLMYSPRFEHKPADLDMPLHENTVDNELAELRRREHKKLHGTCRGGCPSVWLNPDGYCRNHMPKEDKWKGYK